MSFAAIIGINLDYGAQRRPVQIRFFNPTQIFFGDRNGGLATGSHRRLKCGDRDFLKFEWFDTGKGGRLTAA